MKHESDIPRQRRRDQLIRQHVHDPYKTRLKLAEPTICPQCGAVFQDGRWRWAPRPSPAHEELCQACRRINDRYPAGELTITGEFAARHQDEILSLARHQEEHEKAEHPLHRIMEIEERDGGIIVRTSDIHLPRRIGEALRHAFARISSSVSWQSPRQSSNVSTALPPSPAIVIRTRSRGSQRRAPTLWAHRLEGPR